MKNFYNGIETLHLGLRLEDTMNYFQKNSYSANLSILSMSKLRPAAEIMKSSPLAKTLYKEYKELFPGVRGELAIEEALSEDVLAAVALAVRGGFKSDAALAKQQLALKPPPSTHLEHAVLESPEIDQIFRDATIYDRKGERWSVRGINEVGGAKAH